MNFNSDQIKPTAGYVMIEPAKKENKTASGILLPESEHDQPQYGEVLAVGKSLPEQGQLIELDANPGDLVIYRQWSGDVITLKDTMYRLIKFTDVIAIIERKK